MDRGNSIDKDPMDRGVDEEVDVEPGSHSQMVLNSIETQNQDQNQTQSEWSLVSSKDSSGKKVDLSAGDVIRFREDDADEWERAIVLQRTGRSGSTKNTFNVDKDEGGTRINCDKLHVERLTETLEQAVYKQFPANETVEEDTMFLMRVPDSEEVQRAKATELERFKEFGVYQEVKDKGQFAVSSRWVVSQKEKKTKARLVARGFEELKSNVSDAPTAAVASKRIFLMLTASFGWKLETLDITAAFLQADAIMRDVYV